ncbi:putative cytochrome P450 [Hypoxylon sp. EC38]|nr:putative cytochrome P450 [Hypoxylon sp. EC38]
MALLAISPWLLILGAAIFTLLLLLISPSLSYSRRIPGPVLAKFTRLWYAWQQYGNNFHWTNVKLHRQNGKVVQIMPGYFTVDDPASHKTIYGHASPWIKGKFYIAWNVGPDASHTNLFSMRDPKLHATMRRKVASMYSMSSLVSYEPHVDHCVELFCGKLEKMASSKSSINLGNWLQFFAFDTVSMITFGERLGFLDHGEDVENLMQSLHHDHVTLNILGTFPELISFYKKLSGLFAIPNTMFQRFASKKIESGRQEKEEPVESEPISMLRKFLDVQRNDEKKGMSDWDIAANVGSNIGAGSDTTAIALNTIVYYMYRDKRILGRVRKEIAFLPAKPSFHEVQKLTYLQAVIKESLRIQPAVGTPLWREVPKGGAVVCSQFFPEGANIGVNVWVAHHNQEVFGADADEFRPDRWLNAAPSQLGIMEQTLSPFGFGSRTCIGKNISLLEINKVIPALVRGFDFDLVNEYGVPETRDYVPVTNDWFIKMPHLHARVTKRNHITS